MDAQVKIRSCIALNEGDKANLVRKYWKVQPDAVFFGNAVLVMQSDGTAVYIGGDDKIRAEVGAWMPVSRIAAGREHAAALMMDGTVRAIGDNRYGQCEVGQWKDIISLFANGYCTVGVTRQNRTVIAGNPALKDIDQNRKNQDELSRIDYFGTLIEKRMAALPGTGAEQSQQLLQRIAGMEEQTSQLEKKWKDSAHSFAYMESRMVFKLEQMQKETERQMLSRIKSMMLPASVANKPIITMTERFTEKKPSTDSNSTKKVISISAGERFTLMLYADGTVRAIGRNGSGQCNVDNWTKIAAIAAGKRHSVGVRSDGTIVTAGDDSIKECSLTKGWNMIFGILAGDNLTIGINNYGIVRYAGNLAPYNQDTTGYVGQIISEFKSVAYIAAGSSHMLVMDKKGKLTAIGSDAFKQCSKTADWMDLKYIEAGDGVSYALTKAGTVLAVGRTKYRQCDVQDWTDIVAISSAYRHVVGLRSDGTVVATGDNRFGQCDVRGWTDITAISAGYTHTVGLKKDGTIVVAGQDGTK